VFVEQIGCFDRVCLLLERIVKCRKECKETYFQVLRRIDNFITSQFNGSGARTYRYQKILLAFPKELFGFSSDIPKLLLASPKDVLESPKFVSG
jgi:hypothetical protein